MPNEQTLVWDTKTDRRLGVYPKAKAEKQVAHLNRLEPRRYELRPWPPAPAPANAD